MEYKVELQATSVFYIEALTEEEAADLALEEAFLNAPEWAVVRVRENKE